MSSAHGSDIVTKVYRDSNGTIIFNRVQDCEDIIENNKRLANDPIKKDWGRHIASIPAVILERWIREDGVNYLALPKKEFDRLIRRKIRDPEWRFLRTSGGSL